MFTLKSNYITMNDSFWHKKSSILINIDKKKSTEIME